MYPIVRSETLNPQVKLLEVAAPRIAKKANPGQFIILRIDEQGERIPLTISDYDAEHGTVTIIFQVVGKTTMQLATLKEGDTLLDFVGPLGVASHLEGLKIVAVIGGGLGTAIAYPQAKKLHSMGAIVDVIVGFRNKELVILENELKNASSRLIVATDDGSYGERGFVSNVLQRLIDEGNEYDAVIVIGPLPMMKAVCEITRPYAISTIVSMNPIMYDWSDWVWFDAANKFLDAEVLALVYPRRMEIFMGDHDALFDPDASVKEFDTFKEIVGETTDFATLTIFKGEHEFIPHDEPIIRLTNTLKGL